MNTFVERHVNIHNWPGQSSLALGVLEDPVTNVFSLESFQQRTHSFVATYVLNKNSIRGNLLRRPFDALSDLEIEMPCSFASRLLQKKTITLEQSSLGFKYKYKTFSRAYGESFLPLLQSSENEIQIEIALLEKPSPAFEFPKFLGSGFGYRWKPKVSLGSSISPITSQTLVASGNCEGKPFMFVFVKQGGTTKLELRMAASKTDDDDSSETSEHQVSSHASLVDPEEQKNPFAKKDIEEESSDSESISESVAKSIEDKLDRVYEGQSNLSDLRSTLQYPKMIKRQCAAKEEFVRSLKNTSTESLSQSSEAAEDVHALYNTKPSETKAELVSFMIEEIQKLPESKALTDTENDHH